MGSQCRQLLCITLGVFGLLGTIIICVLPMWKVIALIEVNIVAAQDILDGLWTNCVMQTTGQIQSKIYDSLLNMRQDLLAARAFVDIAIVVYIFAVLLAIASSEFASFVEDEVSVAKVELAIGLTFFMSGALVLIPIYWISIAIIQDFFNPLLTRDQRREMGPVLYIGWVTGTLLQMGGALICYKSSRKIKKGLRVTVSKV